MTFRSHVCVASMAATSLVALLAVLACSKMPEPAVSTPVLAPAAPAATAPASSGCAKDNDCKGDRVCEKSQCVVPPR